MMGEIVARTCRVKAIAKNKNAIVAYCWTYFTYYKLVLVVKYRSCAEGLVYYSLTLGTCDDI